MPQQEDQNLQHLGDFKGISHNYNTLCVSYNDVNSIWQRAEDSSRQEHFWFVFAPDAKRHSEADTDDREQQPTPVQQNVTDASVTSSRRVDEQQGEGETRGARGRVEP